MHGRATRSRLAINSSACELKWYAYSRFLDPPFPPEATPYALVINRPDIISTASGFLLAVTPFAGLQFRLHTHRRDPLPEGHDHG